MSEGEAMSCRDLEAQSHRTASGPMKASGSGLRLTHAPQSPRRPA